MTYENAQATTEWLQQEYFNILLRILTDMNKPIKAQELAELLNHAKVLASRCADIVRMDPNVANEPGSAAFWNSVYHNLNQ